MEKPNFDLKVLEKLKYHKFMQQNWTLHFNPSLQYLQASGVYFFIIPEP